MTFTGKVKFTDAQRALILATVAAWEIPHFGQPINHDENIRDEVAAMLAEALGIEQEAAINRMQAFRMTL